MYNILRRRTTFTKKSDLSGYIHLSMYVFLDFFVDTDSTFMHRKVDHFTFTFIGHGLCGYLACFSLRF